MKIELTEEEVNKILNELAEAPYKYTATIINYLAGKLKESQKDIEKE